MIRILIADDHPIVREGLKRIVDSCRDMQIVSEAADGHELLAKVQTLDVDVLLLDISMPGPGFLDLLGRFQAERPDMRVLVLSLHTEKLYAVRALKAGAAGYLTKDHSQNELAEAIRRVYRRGKYVSASLAERLAFQLGGEVERPPHETLSNREYDVLCRLGAGQTATQVASDLRLSPKTISTYRSRVLQKLELANTAELIRYAVEHHLIT